MKMIRFKPDCRDWIKRGIKTTTFRRTRKQGVYEIVEGSWYHPRRLGMYVRLTPITKMNTNTVIFFHYTTEGDFKSPEEFLEWLKKNKLELPELGWLHHVEYLGTDYPNKSDKQEG